MPVRRKTLGNGIKLDCRGRVTQQDLIRAGGRLLTDKALMSVTHFLLLDLSECDQLDISYNEVIELANNKRYFDGALPGFKVAIVAHNDLGFGTARVWESYMNDSSVVTGVFRHPQLAYEWLKVNVPVDPPVHA